MKQVTIINTITKEQTHSAHFDDYTKMQIWVLDCVKKDCLGKKARTCPKSDEYDAALVINEYEQVIEEAYEQALYQTDANGEHVLDDAGEVIPVTYSDGEPVFETIPAITETYVNLKREYEIDVVDVTAEFDQRKINADALKFLKDTDWQILRHRDQIESEVETSLTDTEYQELLVDRQDKRTLIIN